jgi:hypothetical protein
MKKIILPILGLTLLASCGTSSGEKNETSKEVEEVAAEPCYPKNYAEGVMTKKGVEYPINIQGGSSYATIFSTGAAFIVLTDKALPEKPHKTMFNKLDQAAITIKLNASLLKDLPKEVELGTDNPGYQLFYSQLGMNTSLGNKTSVTTTVNGESVTETKLITGKMLIEKADKGQFCITADLVDPEGQKLKFSISTALTPIY